MTRIPSFGLGREFYTKHVQRPFRVRGINPGAAVAEFVVMALSAQEALGTVRAAGYRLVMLLP